MIDVIPQYYTSILENIPDEHVIFGEMCTEVGKEGCPGRFVKLSDYPLVIILKAMYVLYICHNQNNVLLFRLGRPSSSIS